MEIQTQRVLPQTLPKLLSPCEKSTTVRADLHRWISGWKTTVFQGSFVWDWALFLPWWYAVLSCFLHVQLFVMLWIVACQAPLSMGFSRQEYWSGLTCPPPGNLPDPGVEFMSLLFPALAGGGSLTTNATWKAHDDRKHKLWTLINQNVILLKRIPGRKKKNSSTSLVAECYENTCRCRGHGFNPWSRKIPHAVEQLSPCTATKPTLLEPVLSSKRSHHNKKPVHCSKE